MKLWNLSLFQTTWLRDFIYELLIPTQRSQASMLFVQPQVTATSVKIEAGRGFKVSRLRTNYQQLELYETWILLFREKCQTTTVQPSVKLGFLSL